MSGKKAISQDEIMKPAGIKALLKQTAKEGSKGISCAMGHPVGAKKLGLILLDPTTGPAQLAKLLVAEAKAAGSTLDSGSLRFGKASIAPGNDTTIVLKLNRNPDNAMLEAVRKNVLKAGFKEVTCDEDAELDEKLQLEPDDGKQAKRQPAAPPTAESELKARIAATVAQIGNDPMLAGLARRANALLKTGSLKSAQAVVAELEGQLASGSRFKDEFDTVDDMTHFKRRLARQLRENAAFAKVPFKPDSRRPEKKFNDLANQAGLRAKEGRFDLANDLLDQLEEQLDRAKRTAAEQAALLKRASGSRDNAIRHLGQIDDRSFIDFVASSPDAADTALAARALLTRFQGICRAEGDAMVQFFADAFSARQVRDYMRSDPEIARILDAPSP